MTDKTIEQKCVSLPQDKTITNNNETLVKVFEPKDSLALVKEANALIEERAQALCEKRAEQLQDVLDSKAEVAEAYLKQQEQELEHKYKLEEMKLKQLYASKRREVEEQREERIKEVEKKAEVELERMTKEVEFAVEQKEEAQEKYKELKASRREQTKKEVLDFAEGELLAFLKIKRDELKGWRNSEKRRTINNFILFMEEVMNVKSNFLNYHDLESRFLK